MISYAVVFLKRDGEARGPWKSVLQFHKLWDYYVFISITL